MNSIGQRIKSRRQEKKLTQKAVAQFVGKSASAVTQWELDVTQPNGENLVKLARILECTPEWLISGGIASSAGADTPHQTMKQVFELPILSWVQAGEWTQPETIENDRQITEWVETTLKLSPSAFALRVQGDSMTSPHGMSIPEGSIVLVEPSIPSIESVVGKIVIAQTDGPGGVTIKKLARDGADYYLLPLNPAFRAFHCDDGCKIIGAVKQIIIDF